MKISSPNRSALWQNLIRNNQKFSSNNLFGVLSILFWCYLQCFLLQMMIFTRLSSLFSCYFQSYLLFFWCYLECNFEALRRERCSEVMSLFDCVCDLKVRFRQLSALTCVISWHQYGDLEAHNQRNYQLYEWDRVNWCRTEWRVTEKEPEKKHRRIL